VNDFLSGACVLGYFVVGLVFLRSWRTTRDRLFAMFAASFWLLALQRVLLVLTDQLSENRPYLYLLRLAAYLLIVWAIVDKNRK
jgi:hypothetical protein